MHQVTDHMSQIAPNQLERMVPKSDAILVKRIFANKTQPIEQERWSREFLINRLKAHGAFFGSAQGEIGIVSPTSSATYMFVPVDPMTILPESPEVVEEVLPSPGAEIPTETMREEVRELNLKARAEFEIRNREHMAKMQQSLLKVDASAG